MKTYNESEKLRNLFIETITDRQNEIDRKREEGKQREQRWLERTKKFFAEIEFLNEYGFGFYISVEKEDGWTSYPDQKNVFIRSKRTCGYINVHQDGTISNYSCFTSSMYAETYKNAKEFVQAMAKRIRTK